MSRYTADRAEAGWGEDIVIITQTTMILACKPVAGIKRLFSLMLLAAAVLLAAEPCLAVGPIRGRTPQAQPGLTSPSAGQQTSSGPASQHDSLMAQYATAKRDGLAGLATTVEKPKATMTTIRAQRVVDQYVDNALQYLHTIMRDPKVQNELAKIRRREEVAAFVKRQVAQWEHLRTLAREAMALQLEMLRNREALQKAIEDSPQQIKAFVEELKAADDKIKDYLKAVGGRIDQRKRERTVKYVETVVGNVQSAWENLLAAHKEFMDKKQNQPAAYKKRYDRLKARAPNPVQMPTQPSPEFSQTATQITTAASKGYKDYKKAHTDAIAARQPLTTGSAAHKVTTFKGAKPGQLLSTAQGRLQSLPAQTPMPRAGRPQ